VLEEGEQPPVGEVGAAELVDVGVAVVEQVELDCLAVPPQEDDEAEDSPMSAPWSSTTSRCRKAELPPALTNRS
jgi:hypothetical protein